MSLSLGTLKLLYGLLCQQNISVGAKDSDIHEILQAKAELETAIMVEEQGVATSGNGAGDSRGTSETQKRV